MPQSAVCRVRGFLLLEPGVARWGFALSLGTVAFVSWFRFQYFGSLAVPGPDFVFLRHHVFTIGVCFRDVHVSSYPTWQSIAERVLFSFTTQSHPSTPSSSFSSWMWMLERPKKRTAEVLRGLRKRTNSPNLLVIVFGHLACKFLAPANEIYTF